MVHTTRRRREKENESSGVHLDLRGIAANAGATNSMWIGGTQEGDIRIGGEAYEGDDTKKGGDTETVGRKEIDELKSEFERHKGDLATEKKIGDQRDATNKDMLGRLAKISKDRHKEGMEYTGKVEKDAKQGLSDLEEGFGNELGYLRADMNKGFDDVGKKVDGYITTIDDLSQKVEKCERNVSKIGKEVAAYLNRVLDLDGTTEQYKKEIKDLQEMAEGATTQEQLQKAISNVKQKLGHVIEESEERSKEYTGTVANGIIQGLDGLRGELDGYKTKVDELGENVAGFDDKLLEIKGGLIGMVDELSEKTGEQYEGLRKAVDGLSGENAEQVIGIVKNYMGAMTGDIESLKKSPTYIQDTVSEGIIGRGMTKKYQGKHGLGENLTVGGLLDKAGEAENRDEKERLEQIAYAAGAKRCKQLGISYKVLGRSIKHAGDTKDPTYKKGVMRGVKTFLELEKNADRYQSVLSDILEKGTPTKNEKKTLQKMNGALSFVGMSVKPEYGTNGKPTEGYIKELSSKLKGFKELMK